MISILVVVITGAVYAYMAVINHRTTHMPRAAHARIDPRPRPHKVLAHGAHARPHRFAPAAKNVTDVASAAVTGMEAAA